MDNRDAVEAAIRAGDLPALRRAVDPDQNFPHVRDECGILLLIRAIYHGPPTLVQALIAAGANPNAEVQDGFPSLFAAIDRRTPDRYEMIADLLAAGADIRQRAINDYTPLHYAACRNDARAVTLLLAHGADPHARTRIDHYATPLEEAERFGFTEAAAALRR